MSKKIKALKAAFPYTLPILTGYLFLGMAWGVLMHEQGYPLWATALISFLTYAGAMQFIAVNLMALGFNPLYAFLMTLMVNARHLFYGLVMLEKFKGTQRLKPYLIFGLTDETFSLLCSIKPAPEINIHWFMFFITLFNHLYWVVGCAAGTLLGHFLIFNTQGLDFVLTSLFTVIFINQWRASHEHFPTLLALGATILCRMIFGPANFIIPAMLAIILILFLKKPMEVREN